MTKKVEAAMSPSVAHELHLSPLDLEEAIGELVSVAARDEARTRLAGWRVDMVATRVQDAIWNELRRAI